MYMASFTVLQLLLSFLLITVLVQSVGMAPPPPFRKGSNTRNNNTPATSGIKRRRTRIRNFKFKLREQAGALDSQNTLTSAFLNVDGISDAKLKDISDFAAHVSPDLFVLLETKRRKEEIGSVIDVPGYDVTEIRRSDVSGDKKGGGIACYFKNTGGVLFKRHNPDINHRDLGYVNNERVWFVTESQHCKTAICTTYVGCQYPDDRHKEWNDGIYWVLQQEASALRSAGYRLQFLGDFNGHVGSVLGQGVPGNNDDINKNGERFLRFLMNCDLRHVNGEHRVVDGVQSKLCRGLWTRQRGASRSVIDFVGMSVEHMDTVVGMNVDDTGSWGGGSDHNWCWIVLRDKFRRLVRLPKRPVKKNVWNIGDDQDWTNFKENVASCLPQGDLSSLSVDELASSLATSLRDGGVASIGYKKQVSRCAMKLKSLPRHVLEEIELKRQMERNWKSLSSCNDSTHEAVVDAEKIYLEQSAKVDGIFSNIKRAEKKKVKTACSGKTPRAKKNFWGVITGKVKQSTDISAVLNSAGVLKSAPDEVCEEIEKHFCTVFNGSMESSVKEPTLSTVDHDHSYCSSSNPPSMPADHNYAKNPEPQLPRIGKSDSIERNPSNWLGRDFSKKELKLVASKLSDGKSRGWDNIPSEFIKYAPDSFFDVLALLFNMMKSSGVFPHGWNCGRITLIHKKGLREKLGNYRPITVSIALCGFYSKVLNERLIEVVEAWGLLGEVQNGFRKGRCGADNIFILNTILWKAKALGLKVHLGFVDISKVVSDLGFIF